MTDYQERRIIGPEWRESNTHKPYPFTSTIIVPHPCDPEMLIRLSDFFVDTAITVGYGVRKPDGNLLTEEDQIRLATVTFNVYSGEVLSFTLENQDGNLLFDSTTTSNNRIYEYTPGWSIWEAWDSDWAIKFFLRWEIAEFIFPVAPSSPPLPGGSVYAYTIDKDHGFFYDRCITREINKVQALRVSDKDYIGSIHISPGYNLKLVQLPPTTDNIRTISRLEISGIPGAGLGRYQKTQPEDLVIKSIRSVQADAYGHFYFDGDACYFFHPQYGEPLDGYLPSGPPYTYVFDSVCDACCECEDFVTVYNMIKSLVTRARSLGSYLDHVCNDYKHAISKIKKEKTAREVISVDMKVAARCGNFLDIKTYIINNSDKKIRVDSDNQKLSWTFESDENLNISLPPGYPVQYEDKKGWMNVHGNATVNNANNPKILTLDMDTQVLATRAVVVSFRVYFPDAAGGESITTRFTGKAGNKSLSASSSNTLLAPFDPAV